MDAQQARDGQRARQGKPAGAGKRVGGGEAAGGGEPVPGGEAARGGRQPDGRSRTGGGPQAYGGPEERGAARTYCGLRSHGAGRVPHGRARGALGRYGEALAARRLTQDGMTVLARNWRCGRTGEIDIVARDGDALVVCEVKTRRAGIFQHPMAAITPAKASRLRGLAERWLQEHGGAPPGGVRIDLVGVLLPRRGAPVVEHVRGVV